MINRDSYRRIGKTYVNISGATKYCCSDYRGSRPGLFSTAAPRLHLVNPKKINQLSLILLKMTRNCCRLAKAP
mgnify:CR=1 FL=1